MSLIVQDPADPTEVANSYLSLVDWQTRAAELGLDAPTEVGILTGMLYESSKNYMGETVVPFQGTAWPRSGVGVYHAGEIVEYDSDKIPQQVIDAVLYVAVESDVYSTTQGGERVKFKKTDVLEKEFFDDGVTSSSFKRVTRADVLLSKFTSGSSRPSQIVYAV